MALPTNVFTGKFTKERTRKLIKLLRAGNYKETACQAVGISSRTLRDWMKYGESLDAPEKYATFAREVREAEAGAEEIAVSALMTAGTPPPETQCAACGGVCQLCAKQRGFDWRAMEAWLKRRHADRWGDQIQMRIQKEVTEAVDGEQDRILNAVERACARTNAPLVLGAILDELEREASAPPLEVPAATAEPTQH